MPRRLYNPGGNKNNVRSSVRGHTLVYRRVVLFLCPVEKCLMSVTANQLQEHTLWHIERGEIKADAGLRQG